MESTIILFPLSQKYVGAVHSLRYCDGVACTPTQNIT